MLILAHFPAKYINFQMFVEERIFVVQKRLPYGKASIFEVKHDEIKN